MNVDPIYLPELCTIFRTSPPATENDVVLGFYNKKLYLGIVETPDVDDMPEDGHLDVFWFRPNDSYTKSTIFHPSVNAAGHHVCSFVKTEDVYALKKRAFFFKEEGVIRTRLPFPGLVEWIVRPMPPSPSSTKRAPQSDLRQEAKRPCKKNNTSYPTIEKEMDVYKQRVNDILATLARNARVECHTSNPMVVTAALYLDAESARTTRTLYNKGGYRLEDMYCPNDNSVVMQQICANTKDLPGRHPYLPTQTIETFTSVNRGRPFSFAWIDGTCTWAGSGTHSTQEAVLNLFCNNMLAPYSVVAYTASIRGMEGDQSIRAREDMKHNYTTIKRCARRFGYTVECVPKIHHVPSRDSELRNTGQVYTSWMRVWK